METEHGRYHVWTPLLFGYLRHHLPESLVTEEDGTPKLFPRVTKAGKNIWSCAFRRSPELERRVKLYQDSDLPSYEPHMKDFLKIISVKKKTDGRPAP